jgi:hypothetical protein
VDLESYHVLKNYPDRTLSIVRVISDHAEQRIPDLSTAINPEGGLDPLKLGLGLLKEPWAARELIHSSLKALKRLQSITRELFIQ